MGDYFVGIGKFTLSKGLLGVLLCLFFLPKTAKMFLLGACAALT